MNKAATSLLCSVWLIGMVAHVAHAQRDPGGSVLRETNPLQVDAVAAEQEEMLLAHLRGHHLPAAAYVVGQFQKHDVVLLGEDHQIADNCRFVSFL